MNRPGISRDRLVKLCGHGWLVQHGVVAFFGFVWRYMADRPPEAVGG